MIQPQELRIGNYVRLKKKITIDENIVKIKPNDFLTLDYFQPITLTEEWFLKFGAKLFPWGYVLNDFLIKYTKANNKNHYWLEVGNGKRIEFHYVHTLQNFYALTNQELKINFYQIIK